MPNLDPKEIERLVELEKLAAQGTLVRVPSEKDASVWEHRYLLDAVALDTFEKALVNWFSANYPALLEMQKDADDMAEALTVHNDNARSFFQIANRIATELGTHALATNFGAFAETTHNMLKKYHEITNKARAAIDAKLREGK